MEKSTKKSTKIKGLGDIVKLATDALGIEQCEGCEKRQAQLNDAVSFGNIGKLTEMDKLTLKRLVQTNPIADLDSQFITALYNKVFDANEDYCAGCTPIALMQLKELWDYYQDEQTGS